MYVLQIKPSKIEKADTDDYLSEVAWSLRLLNQRKLQLDLEKSKQNHLLTTRQQLQDKQSFEIRNRHVNFWERYVTKNVLMLQLL